MSKLKLTPWYPGNVKPVRVGVYQVQATRRGDSFVGENGESVKSAMRYWNGRGWKWKGRKENAHVDPYDQWRGVLK